MRTSSEQGFIEKVHVTSAKLAETKELLRAIAGITGRRVYEIEPSGIIGFSQSRKKESNVIESACKSGTYI